MFQGVWTTGLTWSSRADRTARRHKTDYHVLEELGSGGFGRVYRAKHRLDGKEYALKVVRASSSSKEMGKILREVQVLSSIRSDHVVRYFSAWIERGDLSEEIGPGVDETTSSWQTSRSADSTSTDTKGDHHPTCNLCQSKYKDWEVTLEQWGLIDTVLQPLDLCVDCYKKSIPVDVDVSNITIRETKVLPECLYMLMEYCESTLASAIEEVGKDDTRIWSLFGQILEGFAHLHANGIIHRDVKPSNIFVHGNVVKIGDLGLATKSVGNGQHSRENESATNSTDVSAASKSSDVGTFLYMAPEVTAGQYYDEKADVYSLGILLVEIFHEFSTGMERVTVLGGLREGSFPLNWSSQHPVACDLAKRMLIRDPPSARPSCFEMLQELQLQGLCQADSTRHWVSDLQSQMRSLQNTADFQHQEIVRLRKLLEIHNISYDRDDSK